MFDSQTISITPGVGLRGEDTALDHVSVLDNKTFVGEEASRVQPKPVFMSELACYRLHTYIKVAGSKGEVLADLELQSSADALVDKMGYIATKPQGTIKDQIDLFLDRYEYLQVIPFLFIGFGRRSFFRLRKELVAGREGHCCDEREHYQFKHLF